MDSVTKSCWNCKHSEQRHDGINCGPCIDDPYPNAHWEPQEPQSTTYQTPVAMGHPGQIHYVSPQELQGMHAIHNGLVPTPPIPCSGAIEKPANPKQAFGDKKPPMHLIHTIAQLHESAALHSGRRKYGENNYLESPVEAMTYVGAILRHLGQWVAGERVDAKEMVHHLGAIRACTNILLTAEATGFLIDNRPITSDQNHVNDVPVLYGEATRRAFAEVEATIEHLNKLYPEKR